MRNFQDTFETRKRSFSSAFSICMTLPLNNFLNLFTFCCKADKKEYAYLPGD